LEIFCWCRCDGGLITGFEKRNEMEKKSRAKKRNETKRNGKNSETKRKEKTQNQIRFGALKANSCFPAASRLGLNGGAQPIIIKQLKFDPTVDFIMKYNKAPSTMNLPEV
jgi:hypothetical protein